MVMNYVRMWIWFLYEKTVLTEKNYKQWLCNEKTNQLPVIICRWKVRTKLPASLYRIHEVNITFCRTFIICFIIWISPINSVIWSWQINSWDFDRIWILCNATVLCDSQPLYVSFILIYFFPIIYIMYSRKYREWRPPLLTPEQVCFSICLLFELFVLLWFTNKNLNEQRTKMP